MPAAVALPLILGGASAAGTIYGAHKASQAGKQAAQVQTDYGNRALDVERQMYEQDRADQQPYRNMGYGALNTLGAMMGPRFNAGGGGFQPSMGGGAFSFGGPPSPSSPMAGGGGVMGPRPVGSGQTPAAAANGGGLVLMRAPNGATKQVPREQVAHYQQQGAQVVNG